MTEEIEYTQKTMKIKSEQQFHSMTNELLKGWKEYKKLDTRMKLLDASVKKYMTENSMRSFENEYGNLLFVCQNRRVLDRSLIEDIEQYKVDTEVNMMYKSPKF